MYSVKEGITKKNIKERAKVFPFPVSPDSADHPVQSAWSLPIPQNVRRFRLSPLPSHPCSLQIGASQKFAEPQMTRSSCGWK